jgi:hypothetical protein
MAREKLQRLDSVFEMLQSRLSCNDFLIYGSQDDCTRLIRMG